MDNSMAINIILGDRSYRIFTSPEEEEFVRKAGKTIETMLKEFSGEYAFKDKQDLFAMIALQNTTALSKLQMEEEKNTATLAEKLQSVIHILDQD